MPATCALRVAELDGVTLEVMGELLNLTRERARQIEASALEHLRKALAQLGLDSYVPAATFSVFENTYTDGTTD